MRYIFLFILIGISIATFVVVVSPRYKEIQSARADITSYQKRLDTAKKLSASREDLIARYNSIPKADLDNLKTALPDSVDNIRLIIQLDSLATKNGLSSLRGVAYDTTSSSTSAPAGPGAAAQKPYDGFTISFETTGQYKNFLSFISDLEQNLRLVDITAVQFGATTAANAGPANSLTYKITLKTYWLKK
jgi:Tfp pilus assembly protein PilO